jgi:hypothetical protein
LQILDCRLAESGTLAEVEAQVESKTRRERVPDDRPAYDFDQSQPDEDDQQP